MTLSVASFRARWTAFAADPADAVVTAALADATAQTDVRVFGDLFDYAVGCLAAHMMAIDPGGQFARLVAKDGTTTYGRERGRVTRLKGGGAWLIGQVPT